MFIKDLIQSCKTVVSNFNFNIFFSHESNVFKSILFLISFIFYERMLITIAVSTVLLLSEMSFIQRLKLNNAIKEIIYKKLTIILLICLPISNVLTINYLNFIVKLVIMIYIQRYIFLNIRKGQETITFFYFGLLIVSLFTHDYFLELCFFVNSLIQCYI
jgi:hypothetical protein